MVRLRSVGVLSCAKIYGVIHVALGILFGLFFVLIGGLGLAALPAQQKLGMIGILVIAVLSPFIYGAIGFVAGAVGRCSTTGSRQPSAESRWNWKPLLWLMFLRCRSLQRRIRRCSAAVRVPPGPCAMPW